MNMREIKAYIHSNRIAEVVNALYNAGFRNLAVVEVQSILNALKSKERSTPVEVGQQVPTEVKLELVCEDENRTAEAVDLIRQHATTGQPEAGWIYVAEVLAGVEITA